MSSDNYYVVRKHPKGGYGYVMEFASDDVSDSEVHPDSPQFPTIEAASSRACLEYAEYGVVVDPACYEPLAATNNSHLPECSLGGNSLYEWMDDCICDNLRACEQRIKAHEGCADAERLEGYDAGHAEGFNNGLVVGKQIRSAHDIAALIEQAEAKHLKDIRERVASELASLVADASISKNSARRIGAAIDGGAA